MTQPLTACVVLCVFFWCGEGAVWYVSSLTGSDNYDGKTRFVVEIKNFVR
jgi:hypothetical protein